VVSELIDTTEMYLRTIFELEEEGTPPLRARIAERLSHSGPTVSQTVARMQRDGLLAVGTDRRIELSDAGRAKAARVMRKHRLAECMLADLLHLDADKIHAEACRWEHVMSEDVERRLLDVLGHPRQSPFGNPIPALEELDERPAEVSLPDTALTLAAAAGVAAGQGLIRRIDETAQSGNGTLTALQRVDAGVGDTVTFRREGDGVLVGRDGHYAFIAGDAADHILVVPSGPSKGEQSHAD
jgi:DtxR family Mn-dependent transcriptional regulator